MDMDILPYMFEPQAGKGGFQEKSEKEKLVKKETMITARTIKDEYQRTGPFMLN